MKRINKAGEIVGKSYATRKQQKDRPESDFYETPKSLVWELLQTDVLKDVETILEPCCGNNAITRELLMFPDFKITARDIKTGNDFLTDDYSNEYYDAVVTNPPFSLWTEIVEKAKKVAKKVVVIGKTNFFGVQDRYERNLWDGLKEVYIFTRQIDYQFPVDTNGLMGVGNLVTGWFIWEKGYKGKPELNFIDVQKYVKLGSYSTFLKNQLKGENKNDNK